jgi:uncharacterized protein
MPPWYQWQGEDLLLSVRVQPKASRDELVGPEGDHCKIRISAPPVDGKANAGLVKFLAKAFGVAPRAVAIEAGEAGRAKRIRIRSPSELPKELQIIRTNK